MNEVLRQLKERKSVRAFTERKISPEDRDLLIEAALQAPTAGNQILYTIVDVEDQALKEALSITCDKQPFIAKAPLVFVFLADCRRWTDAYAFAGTEHRKPAVNDLMLAYADALIAAQNTVVAAHSLGLGSCYIGDIVEQREKVTELLALDPYVFPAAMVVYGYPTEQQIGRPKPRRFDAKYIVRKNAYSRLDEGEIRAMFAETHDEESFDFDRYVAAFCKRKYMSDFSLEMKRSVELYLKPFLEDEAR